MKERPEQTWQLLLGGDGNEELFTLFHNFPPYPYTVYRDVCVKRMMPPKGMEVCWLSHHLHSFMWRRRNETRWWTHQERDESKGEDKFDLRLGFVPIDMLLKCNFFRCNENECRLHSLTKGSDPLNTFTPSPRSIQQPYSLFISNLSSLRILIQQCSTICWRRRGERDGL